MTDRKITFFVAVIVAVTVAAALLQACHKKKKLGSVTEEVDYPVMKPMVIRAGEICPDDMVYVPEGEFCIDIFEYPGVTGEVPLADVNFEDAKKLCAYQEKRLPTWKEWRMACETQTKKIYFYGNKYEKDRCSVDKAVSDGPEKCGSKTECSNSLGIYDMSGNLWEWVDGIGPQAGDRLMAGGAWMSWESMARCDFVTAAPAGEKHITYGFRCAYTPELK